VEIPLGHLWVANTGPAIRNGNVTEYINGVFNPSATITNRILGPAAVCLKAIFDFHPSLDFLSWLPHRFQ
jgi:hypothetical protein